MKTFKRLFNRLAVSTGIIVFIALIVFKLTFMSDILEKCEAYIISIEVDTHPTQSSSLVSLHIINSGSGIDTLYFDYQGIDQTRSFAFGGQEIDVKLQITDIYATDNWIIFTNDLEEQYFYSIQPFTEEQENLEMYVDVALLDFGNGNNEYLLSGSANHL